MGRRRFKLYKNKSEKNVSGININKIDLERTKKLIKIIQQVPLENEKPRLVMIKRLIHEILNMNLIISETKERLPAQVTNNKDTIIQYIYLLESWNIRVHYFDHNEYILVSFWNLTTKKSSGITINPSDIDEFYGNTPELLEKNKKFYKSIKKSIIQSLQGRRQHNLTKFPEWLDLRPVTV